MIRVDDVVNVGRIVSDNTVHTQMTHASYFLSGVDGPDINILIAPACAPDNLCRQQGGTDTDSVDVRPGLLRFSVLYEREKGIIFVCGQILRSGNQ